MPPDLAQSLPWQVERALTSLSEGEKIALIKIARLYARKTASSAPRFAAGSRNFLMRSREESSLKTDALRYLADALSEDVAATPESKILAEERDDSAQRPPLALAFDELLADAKALARKRGTVPGISRADTPGADTGTPLETLLREMPENFGDRAAPGPEQAADNWGSWSRQIIPALLGRLTARLQTRTALSAFATLLLVAILVPALYERFAEHPGGSPLVQREEFPAPDSAPLPPQPQTAPSQRSTTNPANVEAIPQLPRVSTLPAMPPGLQLRQPQNPAGTSETASAAPGAQQPIDPAVRRIASFLNSYDGGDCFLIVPLKIAEADTQIEVYGGSRAPFTSLDGEFARENGFRAVISRHQVTEAQCGAVNFVRRLRNQSGTARRLDIRTETQAGGPVQSATVGGFGGDNLELLLIGADGRVEKLRSLVTPSGQTRRSRQGAAQPQLLVAVVSALPIEALKPAVLDKAYRLFGEIFAETQQANNTVNAAVKYFELN
jgi:hypothetical protein